MAARKGHASTSGHREWGSACTSSDEDTSRSSSNSGSGSFCAYVRMNTAHMIAMWTGMLARTLQALQDVIILFPWWLFRNFAWSGSKHDHGCGSGPQTISATCSGCGSSHKRQKNTRLRSGSGRLTRGTALLFGHDGRARWPHSRPNCAKHALRGGCYPYLAYQKSKLGTAGLRAVPPHVKIPWKILAGPCSLGTYFLQARVELAVLASAVGLPGEPGRTLAGQG